MKFLVPNYSCFQDPWLEGYRPQIPVHSVLCPQLNLLNPPEQNSWVRHCHQLPPLRTNSNHFATLPIWPSHKVAQMGAANRNTDQPPPGGVCLLQTLTATSSSFATQAHSSDLFNDWHQTPLFSIYDARSVIYCDSPLQPPQDFHTYTSY